MDPGFGDVAAAAASTSQPVADHIAAAEHHHASADFLDFEMAMFNNEFADASQHQQQQTSHHQHEQASFIAALDDAVYGGTPPNSDHSMMMMMNLPDASTSTTSNSTPNPASTLADTQNLDSTISPWGSLPSEPKVMRTTTSRHRRVSSIGAAGGGIGGDDKLSHRRSLSFHTMPAVEQHNTHTHTIPEFPSQQQQQHHHQPAPAPPTFRPSHRRGQSLGGHALHHHSSAASLPQSSAAFMTPPPIPRPTSFPSAAPTSTNNSAAASSSLLSQDDLLAWANEQSPFIQINTSTRPTPPPHQPPRASLPDISTPSSVLSPASGTRMSASHIGHRRGYSIGTVAPDAMNLLSHAPLSRDLAGPRQHSADNVKTNNTASREAAMHARQLAVGHRRGQSLGQHAAAYINTASFVNDHVKQKQSGVTLSSMPAAQQAHHSMPNLYTGISGMSPGMQASQCLQQAPTTAAPSSASSSSSQNIHHNQHPQHNHAHHARSLSLQSLPYIDSPSAHGVAINSASTTGGGGASADMDPAMLETFVNMHLQNGSNTTGAVAGGAAVVGDAEIRAQELSILNELQGGSTSGAYDFGNVEEFAMQSGDAKLDQPHHQHQQQQHNSNGFYTSMLSSSAPQQHESFLAHLHAHEHGDAHGHYHVSQQQQQQQQQHAAAVAAEGLGYLMRPKLEDVDIDDDASVSGEDDEEDDQSGGEAERACQWVDCDAVFKSVDELVAHVSDLHIGVSNAFLS
ncbi:hypothetical protein HDU89_008196 [Geranomyces variabilis]|nr:hypothetical protein HDU89_008196 [Geranomyces variabilis]